MNLEDKVRLNRDAIRDSTSYELAEYDINFLKRDENRPLRMQLELLKTETLLRENDIQSTVVIFGGTQIVPHDEAKARLVRAQNHLKDRPQDPVAIRDVARAKSVLSKCHYYEAARKFGEIASGSSQSNHQKEFVIMTGGGPGIMEAANRGAFEIGAKSIGLNIELPFEQEPNHYITPELCFQFHYFAMRKFHFILRAAALVVFPGGFGTLDELFNTLCLRQTSRMQEIPIILFGRSYWDSIVDFQQLADEGVIADKHLTLIDYAETPEEAWKIITEYSNVD